MRNAAISNKSVGRGDFVCLLCARVREENSRNYYKFSELVIYDAVKLLFFISPARRFRDLKVFPESAQKSRLVRM